jgi:hypothetical protein
MIPYKVFIQVYLALTINQDPAVTPHLCSALRENVNFSEMMQQCADVREENCLENYLQRCEEHK